MIPRVIHQTWLGTIPDRHKKIMDEWKMPGWGYKLWTMEHMESSAIYKEYLPLLHACPSYLTKTDVIRAIVLYHHGGFFVDADAKRLRTPEDLTSMMAGLKSFGCYNNEFYDAGSVASGFIGCEIRAEIAQRLLELFMSYDLDKVRAMNDRDAYLAFGPVPVTYVWQKFMIRDFVVFPSAFFIPNYYTGMGYTEFPAYCDHLWDYSSTKIGPRKKYCFNLANNSVFNELRLIHELTNGKIPLKES